MQNDDLTFLQAKLDCYTAATGGTAFRQLFEPHLEQLRGQPKMSRAQAKRFDRDMDKFFNGIGSARLAGKAREQLVAQFGFASLSNDQITIVRRVLKRGRMTSDGEAETVRDFVANLTNEETLGTAEFERLAKILDEAGY